MVYDTNSGALFRRMDLPDTYGAIIFRRGVAVDARHIAVSTLGSDFKTGYFGRVDLFDRKTGAHLRTFHRPENGIPYNNGAFGFELILNGDDLVVSAIYDSEKGRSGGTVWVYDIPSGDIKRRFVSPLPRKNHEFGISVALWQRYLLIAQPDARVGDAKEAGAVWVFDYETGDLIQAMLSPDPKRNRRFGLKVITTDQNVLVRAERHHQDEADINGSAAIYLFKGQ